MFLACSLPIESPLPVMEQASSINLPNDIRISSLLYKVVCIISNHFIRSQDTYYLTEDTTCSDEEEERNADVRNKKKYLVFESCLLQLLKWCCNCGRGTLLTVKGTCTEGHVLNW